VFLITDSHAYPYQKDHVRENIDYLQNHNTARTGLWKLNGYEAFQLIAPIVYLKSPYVNPFYYVFLKYKSHEDVD